MHVTEAVALLASKEPPTLSIQTIADAGHWHVLVFVHFMTRRTGSGKAGRQRWQRAVKVAGNKRRARSDIQVSTDQ